MFGIRICQRSGRSLSFNYSGISGLSAIYNILSSILLSRFLPYGEEIIVLHQCGFQHNRSTTDHIFCIRQILAKK
jgi:uncharacterized membrane protein YfhO